ncbi:hypothetical protein [Streptomyces nogalater]|uniref:Uncharacterized protein n=1 Tax=Streptomyces nogalater TaxID=38314 RepID=A0ABW0W8W8_STRNO
MGWIHVLSYDGPTLIARDIDAADERAAERVRDVLAAAGIRADAAPHAGPHGRGVLVTLYTDQDANRLLHAVVDRLPPPETLVLELTQVMQALDFSAPTATEPHYLGGYVVGIQLSLPDARTVWAALGGPPVELRAADGRELFVVADALAEFLGDELGGDEIKVDAYPARADFCADCTDHLLVLHPLSIEQTEKLTSALAQSLLHAHPSPKGGRHT